MNKPSSQVLLTLGELKAAVRKSFIALALPTLEFFTLRLWVNQVLGLEFGWVGLTDWDFLVALPVALAIALCLMSRSQTIQLKVNRRWLIVNVISLVLFVGLNVSFEGFSRSAPVLTVTVWTALALGTIGSAFFISLSPSYLLRHPGRAFLVPGLIIAAAPLFSQTLLSGFWEPLARWAAKDSHLLLNKTLGSVQALSTTEHGVRIILRHPDLGVSIGRGCGGLDAFVLFFIFAFCLRIFRSNLLSPGAWILALLVGLPFMYLLNVLRISAFFMLAVFMRRIWAPGPHEDFVMALFHSHAGWMIYVGGIFGYFEFVRWVAGRYHDVFGSSKQIPGRAYPQRS